MEATAYRKKLRGSETRLTEKFKREIGNLAEAMEKWVIVFGGGKLTEESV